MLESAIVAPAERHDPSPLLSIEKITKSFAGLRALDEVSLEINSGEIIALVGHNGSGKSTLVKILAGVYQSDSGTVAFSSHEEAPVQLHVIHQDLGLVPQLTAIENLEINRARSGSLSPIRNRAEGARARMLFARFGEQFDVTVPVGRLAPAQRSIIAIARALDGWSHSKNILILDEPTEALHSSEVAILFDAIRTVAAAGAGVIFISHRLDEVLTIADRVVVLRDGQKIADVPRPELDHDALVIHVTGAALGSAGADVAAQPFGAARLEVRGLRGPSVDGVDLVVHTGEVLGVAGVLGSGRESVPALVFGSMPSTADRFVLSGEPYDKRSPTESIRRGMGFVVGERVRFGSVGAMSARENMTLPELASVRGRLGSVNVRRERAVVTKLMDTFHVRPARSEQTFSRFSGGNQQKIVFAKWLRNDPTLLILEEPTQGVDIGAKQVIYDAIDEASRSGTAVLVCSSEAKELIRLCDRVLVLRNGRVAAELAGDELTESRLILEGYGLAPSADQTDLADSADLADIPDIAVKHAEPTKGEAHE